MSGRNAGHGPGRQSLAASRRPFAYHMAIARRQTLVQLTDELVRRLDEKALRLERTRSSLIREALEQYLHDEIEAEIDRQIVEAYTRTPQTEEELAWAEWQGAEMIRQEPW